MAANQGLIHRRHRNSVACTWALPQSTQGARIVKSEDGWREHLTPEQFQVTRRKGTERPFTGAYWNLKDDGVYACVCCGRELFNAETKFDSGTAGAEIARFESTSECSVDSLKFYG